MKTDQDLSVTEATAIIIANTFKKKRSVGITDLAKNIQFLIDKQGSIKAVSETVGLSQEMLNQFLKVKNLSDKAYEQVVLRRIDSVSVVNGLSKFSKEDQDALLDYILNGKLNGDMLKFVSPIRRRNPEKNISDIVSQLINSQNKRLSVIHYEIGDNTLPVESIRSNFLNLIGEENLSSVTIEKDIGKIRMTRQGEKHLRAIAKQQKKALQDFVPSLIQKKI